MRWPWRRKRQQLQDDRRALETAREHLEQVRGQWPRVEAAVEALRVHRQRNHFAENIERIYAGRRT